METHGLTFRDLRNAILFGALVFLIIVFIRDVVDVILVFSIAALLVISLSPIVTWMARHKIPRWAGTAIVVLVLFGTFVLIVYFVAPLLVAQFTQFSDALPDLIDRGRAWVASIIARYPGLADGLPALNFNTIGQITRPFIGGIGQITAGTIYTVAALIVIVITTIYSLINPKPLVDGFLDAFDPQHKERVAAAGQRMAIQIWAWAKGTVFAMFAIFALTWLALWLLGFKQALLFAVIAGILEIVPTIGPILSAVPPILVALVTEPVLALWVVGAFIAIQQFENHVLIPLVMSHQVRLHPVTIIFFVLVMGVLFGIVGIFVATPTAVAAGVLYDELYLCEFRKRCQISTEEKDERDEQNEKAKEAAREQARKQAQEREEEGRKQQQREQDQQNL